MDKEVKFSTRLVAYLLDCLLVYLVVSILVNIRFINPNYDKYQDEYEKYTKIVTNASVDNPDELINDIKDSFYNLNKYGVAYNIAISIIIILYFGIFQKFNNGQTLGKKIMKIKVVNAKDESNVSLSKAILRATLMQYAYIGSVITLLLTTIMVYLLNKTQYLYSYVLIITGVGLVNIISLFFILFKKDKRGVHDLVAGTKVMKE